MPATDSTSGLNGVRQLLEPWLRDLAGARLSGEVPVAERLLNRLIADRLRTSTGRLERAHVRLRADAAIDIRLVLRRPRFVPALTVTVRIEEQPTFPQSPVVVFRWSLPGLGPLAAIFGPALTFFKAPPPGLVVRGDRLIVDLVHLLEQHGAGGILASLRALRIEPRHEMLLVTFELQISTP